MSKTTARRHILEKNTAPKEKEKTTLSKHLKKIYPIGLQRSTSSLSSLSSLSLSLSQNSNDSFLTDSSSPLEQKISLALRLISQPERREVTVAKNVQQHQHQTQDATDGELRRCNWITKNSGKPI